MTETTSCYDLVLALAPSLVSVVAIIVTSVVAIRNIRKTAEESRVTEVHKEMAKCLADTIEIIDRVLYLLNGVANSVTYHDIQKDLDIETAHDRYWKEIGELSIKFKSIFARQRLFFHQDLYKKMQEIISQLNKARELAREPDNEELRQLIKKISSSYNLFINEARSYLGTDRLDRLAENISLGSAEK